MDTPILLGRFPSVLFDCKLTQSPIEKSRLPIRSHALLKAPPSILSHSIMQNAGGSMIKSHMEGEGFPIYGPKSEEPRDMFGWRSQGWKILHLTSTPVSGKTVKPLNGKKRKRGSSGAWAVEQQARMRAETQNSKIPPYSGGSRPQAIGVRF